MLKRLVDLGDTVKAGQLLAELENSDLTAQLDSARAELAIAESQQKILDTHPGLFLRGLIHSDGCRLTNWATLPVAGELKRYEYPRYFFSNKSLDILALCRAALDRLGIAYRRPGGTRCRSRGGRRSPRSTSGSARRPDVTHIPLLLLDQIAAPS